MSASMQPLHPGWQIIGVLIATGVLEREPNPVFWVNVGGLTRLFSGATFAQLIGDATSSRVDVACLAYLAELFARANRPDHLLSCC